MNADDELASVAPLTAGPAPARLARAARTRRGIIWGALGAIAALLTTASVVWLPDLMHWGYYEPMTIPAAVVRERCGIDPAEDVPAGSFVAGDVPPCNIGYQHPSGRPPLTVDAADPRGTCERAVGYSGLASMRLLSSSTIDANGKPGLVAFFLSRNGYLGLCGVIPDQGSMMFFKPDDVALNEGTPVLVADDEQNGQASRLRYVHQPVIIDGRLLTDAATVRITIDATGETFDRPVTNGIANSEGTWTLKQPVSFSTTVTVQALDRNGTVLGQLTRPL